LEKSPTGTERTSNPTTAGTVTVTVTVTDTIPAATTP
jgi:hypothetical protein